MYMQIGKHTHVQSHADNVMMFGEILIRETGMYHAKAEIRFLYSDWCSYYWTQLYFDVEMLL